jgi:RNA polymerase sigma-70 factor (ECF subfamily)
MTRLPHPWLVTRALEGGERELDDLAKAWLPHVYHWCHRLGGPTVDAEDAAHDALMVLCRRLQRVSSPEQFPAWLFGIVRRVVANHRRKAWVRRWVPTPFREGPSPDRSPESRTEAHRAAERVWAVLDALPPHQREVLVLCHLEEHSATEAADLLGIPPGTVKSRLRAARKAFRAICDTPSLVDPSPEVSR